MVGVAKRRAGSSLDGLGEGAPSNGGAPGDAWTPVRAALRYVTHKPWNRIPALTRTFMYNPVLACLAGGRNKARLPYSKNLGACNPPLNDVPCHVQPSARSQGTPWWQSCGNLLCSMPCRAFPTTGQLSSGSTGKGSDKTL